MSEQTPTHPAAYLLRSFAAWYTLRLSKKIVHTTRDGLTVVGTVVPFVFLIRTFASPWKQIRDDSKPKGSRLSHAAEALTLNLTARSIGMVCRTFALVLGIVLALAVTFVGVAALVLWVVFPVFWAAFLILAVIVV